MTIDTATPANTTDDAPPARAAVYAAGPDAPDTALSVLLGAGWAFYQDHLGNRTPVSSNGQARREFGPETARYAHNSRTALWEIAYTDANPYRANTWTAHFGDQVPAKTIAAFLRSLTDPAGLEPDRA